MSSPLTDELRTRREKETSEIGFEKKARMPSPLRTCLPLACHSPALRRRRPASLRRLVENLIRFFTLRLFHYDYAVLVRVRHRVAADSFQVSLEL